MRSKSEETNFLQSFFVYVNEFTVCSLVGWLYETVCESIFAHGLVLNRGFLHLPVCPIYGFGAFIALFIISRLKNMTPVKVFFGGVMITTVVEYIAALIIETLLHKTLWDYTPWICDFQGRVSLISSLIFGLGCLGAYKLRPLMHKHLTGSKIINVLAVIELVLMIGDFLLIVL